MQIINSDIYALDDPSARRVLIEQARAQLDQQGAALFPNFVRPQALESMASEALENLGHTHRRDMRLGINPKDGLELSSALAASSSPYRMWSLGSDLLDRSRPLQMLYRSPELVELVREAVGEPTLHCTADPLINATVTYMGDGDQQGWHFDDNGFVVSLLLQQPAAGGEFEYVPAATSLPPEQVEKIVEGSSPLVRRLVPSAGTLILFRGRHALHRVAPVAGAKHRVMALFSYDSEAGFIYSDSVRINSLGRCE